MKIFVLSASLCFFLTSALAQGVKKTTPVIAIDVPDFADVQVKKFYNDYAIHLAKCVEAIRQKDEAKVTSLFKNPGEQLVAREKILAKELVKNPVEKQKYMQFAEQAYPYIKEVQRSSYYQKMYGNK